jgi:hypothetical protein
MKTKSASRSRADRLRDWFAMRMQRRRRRNSTAPHVVIPAPVLDLEAVEWGGTEDGWADVVVNVSMDATGLPWGVIEFYVLLDSDYVMLVELAPAEGGYRHEKVTQIYGEEWTYVARFRTGDDVGPMSQQLVVEIPPP